MPILAEIHRREGINLRGKTIHRTAVRGVILHEANLLMIYSTAVGDFKFPGGGVDAGETHEQALRRELQEECGASLVQLVGEIGVVVEYSFPIEQDHDVFRMTSHYYRCEVQDGFGVQKLDGYERDLGFVPVWVDMDEAIQVNRHLLDLRESPEWLRREIFVLEFLKQNIMNR